MASLEGYHRESSYDRFKDHIERNFEAGRDAQGSPARFASLHCLTQYWTAAHVQEIVSDTGDLDYQIEDIRQQYLRIFSILVWISMTGRSYVRYLKHFVRNGRDDYILPFRERPAFLPSTTDSEVFWTTFFKEQWTFCPVQLRGMYNRNLHPNQILPFTICGDLGSQNIGRPAKIQLAKVHASETLAQTLSTGGNIVLKSYDTRYENNYQNEINAYHAFDNAKPCENILKYVGSYCVQPLAPGSGLQYTIMLEHAERGSLLQLYGEIDPPITLAETKAFWSSLLQVAKGLMVAHNTIPRRQGASCVHQDLKPSNIFVFGREDVSTAEFDLTLKIGDFGNSHTRRSAPYDPGRLGYDSGSTRTYCPPELYWSHEVDFIVGPLQDMWSLGCVLIEAAVWVSFGRRGRAEFQQRRRHENDVVAPLQRALGRSDCFHNGKTRLKTVEEVFDLVQKDGRRSDELTPKVVRLVLDHLLVDEDSRFEARILSTELEKIIRTTTDCPDDRSSHRISTASSATRSHRSQEFRHPQHNGIYEPQSASPRSQYEPPTPSTTIESMSQNQIPYVDGVSSTGTLPNRGSSFRSHINPAEPWNHDDGNQRLHRIESGQLSMTPPTLNGMHGIHSERYVTSPIYGGFDSDEYRRAKTASVDQGLILRCSEHTQSLDQPWPAQRAPTTVTNRSNSTVTHSQFTDYKRATFPDLTMESVNERRAEGKSPKSRRLLPGEDQAMIFLKRRDHILVVDNSKHMREFKSQVLDVFANLAHILEAADPNGLDVMCTSDPGNMQVSKATDKLVRYVQSNFDKGGTSPCFIETALKTLIDKVIDKLPSGPGERKKLMARIKNDRVRPVSIYVLTSGVWNSSEAAREGTCGAERPINQLITELQKRNLHKSQVAIQFIRLETTRLESIV